MSNQSDNKFIRNLKDSWYVNFNENGYPHVQQGWILPPDRHREFDPFILMADDWFKRGTFSDHPHRGFQTITYVVDGRLEHTDNHGGHSVLDSGDVQYMNAGSGARHAEEAVDNDLIHTHQLWLNLPKKLKQSKASYQNVYSEEAPVSQFAGGQVKVYAGTFSGVTGPMNSLVPIIMAEVTFTKEGEHEFTLPDNHNGFLFVRHGSVVIGDNDTPLTKTAVATLTYNENGNGDESTIRIKANERSRLLLYSGVPIKEEIVTRGPFVMNSMDEIRQAYKDFHEGKFGPPV
ncbi:pirin family protein [Salipaludibacillus sp. CUR1]|uniref:pirin family protein n=1 Tax=Salipaludibacillus sp. CUR1 TaxID=2820003 RepID=UPI001E5876AC|nr:pirin-like C-terminal cupin domain-containing protein [Salipaludibacillus sp. CUR1]MCE7791784.1 pirin family protein [Salipaludibacillus sp. CUR1]